MYICKMQRIWKQLLSFAYSVCAKTTNLRPAKPIETVIWLLRHTCCIYIDPSRMCAQCKWIDSPHRPPKLQPCCERCFYSRCAESRIYYSAVLMLRSAQFLRHSSSGPLADVWIQPIRNRTIMACTMNATLYICVWCEANTTSSNNLHPQVL